MRNPFIGAQSSVLRYVGIVIASTTLWIGTPGIAQAQEACGDINGDGNISPVDALTILNAAVGVEVNFACPSPASIETGNATAPADGCGDANGDGMISPVDALLVLNRSVGFDVEFNCPAGTDARNRVRYLNSLICQGENFNSVLRLPAESMRWESVSGVASEYQDYNKEQLGGGWKVSLGPCGDRDFTDLVNLPEGRLIRVELELTGIFNFVDLTFWDEAPLLTAGDEEAEPIARIRFEAPDGIGKVSREPASG
jgi:hypothetical protein